MLDRSISRFTPQRASAVFALGLCTLLLAVTGTTADDPTDQVASSQAATEGAGGNGGGDGAAVDEFTAGERLFALNVRPLVAERCLPCHGDDPDDLGGSLDLTSREGMLAGGDSERPVLVPGNAAESLLYGAVTWEDEEYQMPPKENDRLSEQEAWYLRDWINEGAPWPDEARVALIREAHERSEALGERVATSGGLSEDWDQRLYEPEQLWAYRPLRRPRVPDAEGAVHPVDAFLQRQLEEVGLPPAPRASRRELIRRVTWDLTGLPPTPAEVEAFVGDPASDREAFGRLVDRLLASPRYGEQWGRHWLDVVRYADSAGFANDFERPNAWRYRDYVIRAFNADKPYDQFVMEQLAGDEIDSGDPEILIATGFLRMGPWEQTGMSVARITRQQYLDDVTSTVGQVFLAHPLQCARCHDHKFDPIPTRDYYRIQAVFATTQFADRDVPFLDEENRNGFDERRYLEERIAHYEAISADIRARNEAAERAWYAERGLEYAPRQTLMRQGVPEDQIAPRHLGLTAADFGLERIARKSLIRHRWELDRYRPVALSVYSGNTVLRNNVSGRLRVPEDPLSEGETEQTAILAGGDPFAPAEPVNPGTLSAVCDTVDEPELAAPVPADVDGRREAFARWVAHPDNPLTSRTMVNRVWAYHFGKGLAANPNNFGATGARPTHPQLLDWLATRFIDDGWSVKGLHRIILTSDAYCRSTRHPQDELLAEKDPERRWYGVFAPRRLSAEEIRDGILFMSGELNLELGGIPARPNLNFEAAMQPRQIMGTYAPAYQPSPLPRQRNRRTIYAIRLRGLRDPFLEVFNQPALDDSCEGRDSSNVTPQVFMLFNSRNSYERALGMADRLMRETDSPDEAIDRAFRLAYGRSPDPDERQLCLDHWEALAGRHERVEIAAREVPTEVHREAAEEMSGERFTFVETLETNRDYVPDLQPHQVDARTRALADVCLVLFNANEFVYVY